MWFFSDENRRFYINEMARIVGTTQGTCRRELNRLTTMGILSASKEGNLKYYTINVHYPLYDEFRAIIKKTIGIEAIIRTALQGSENINFSIIFGPYAREKIDPEADIDIAVVGDISEEGLIELLRDVPLITGREINYYIYKERDFIEKLQTNSFAQNILSNFILVAGDERRLSAILQNSQA
jgi:predicted nucleotidyltransferase